MLRTWTPGGGLLRVADVPPRVWADNPDMTRLFCALATAVVGITCAASAASAAPSYQNCTQLHQSYPHGIGRADARDKTSGTPVTTFTKDTAGYNRAIRANGGLDRDGDGIACERR